MQDDIIGYGYNIDHARFLGFVPGPVTAVSWLGDMMASGYNRHAGSFANYPAGCVAEHELLRWFCDKAGLPEGAGGVFVSGGSMANMTALVAARDEKLAPEDWRLGVAYVSEQTHSSVAKGLHIVGIGADRVRTVPCHEDFTMDTEALERAIERDRESGLIPFAVIATAGSTNTGSVDPLYDIALIARRHGLWMHVDGAIGASVLLTKYRGMLDGIELADSLSWDAHKWLFQTYSCGLVLVRDERKLLKSFSTHPEYLKDLEDGAGITNPWDMSKWLFQTYSCGLVLVRDERKLLKSFSTHPEYLKDLEDGAGITNPWDMSPELTRPARGLKLWFSLQVMGSNALSAAVEHGFDLARWAEDEMRANPMIEVVSPAQMAMVNFRYNPAGLTEDEKDQLNALSGAVEHGFVLARWAEDEMRAYPMIEVVSPAQMAMVNFRYSPAGLTEDEKDRLNARISRRMIESGYAGVFTTELDGKKVLRICAIHPEAREEDMRETVRRLNAICEEELAAR